VGSLQPVTQTVRADSLMVFRIGGGPKAPTSALPIGALASFVDPLKVCTEECEKQALCDA
jgi:polyribonucleotide 5'-hydroxyl-kinase